MHHVCSTSPAHVTAVLTALFDHISSCIYRHKYVPRTLQIFLVLLFGTMNGKQVRRHSNMAHLAPQFLRKGRLHSQQLPWRLLPLLPDFLQRES
jgi:hypothetical protein